MAGCYVAGAIRYALGLADVYVVGCCVPFSRGPTAAGGAGSAGIRHPAGDPDGPYGVLVVFAGVLPSFSLALP